MSARTSAKNCGSGAHLVARARGAAACAPREVASSTTTGVSPGKSRISGAGSSMSRRRHRAGVDGARRTSPMSAPRRTSAPRTRTTLGSPSSRRSTRPLTMIDRVLDEVLARLREGVREDHDLEPARRVLEPHERHRLALALGRQLRGPADQPADRHRLALARGRPGPGCPQSTLAAQLSRTSASGWLERYRPSVSLLEREQLAPLELAGPATGRVRAARRAPRRRRPRLSKIVPWPRIAVGLRLAARGRDGLVEHRQHARAGRPWSRTRRHLIRLSSTRSLTLLRSRRARRSPRATWNGPPSSRAWHDRAHRVVADALDRRQAEADLAVDAPRSRARSG